MCIVPGKQRSCRGFTLLEITLAVAILGMVTMAIYRFVAANIVAVQISSQDNAMEASYSGFISLLTAQMGSLSSEAGLMGEPYKFSDQSQDEMTWISGSGPGLLTRYAPGEFLVSLRLKRSEKGDKMELGVMRKPRDDAEGSAEGESWVPLLDDVRGLQIRYFDPRLPAWVERWTDARVLPRLVRLVIGRPDRSEPMEAIIALGRTPLQIQPLQQLPTQAQPGVQQPQPGVQQPQGQQQPGGQQSPPSKLGPSK